MCPRSYVFLEKCQNLLRVTASFTGLRVAPIVIATLGALSTAESELLECLNGVEALGVLLELGLGQGFDFL
jgi:hypothetical protein